MVGTRRGANTAQAAAAAAAERQADASSSTRPHMSTRTAAPRPSAATPVKIEFADETGEDEDEDDDGEAAVRRRPARRAAAAGKGKAKATEVVEAEATPQRKKQPRQTAAPATPVAPSHSLNIAEIRQMMRDRGGGRVSTSPATPAKVKAEEASPAQHQPDAQPKKTKRVSIAPSAVVKRKSLKAELPREEPPVPLDIAAILFRALSVVLLLSWFIYNRQTHLIGYCDSSPATTMASSLFDPTASDASASSGLRPNSNALLRTLAQHDAQLESNSSSSEAQHDDAVDGPHPPWLLALFPPYLRPTCSPCPAHAVCQNGDVLGCASREYAATSAALMARIPLLKNLLPHDGKVPIWLGGGGTADGSASKRKSTSATNGIRWLNRPLGWLFSLAHGPRCLPDTHKLFLALQVGDEIRRVTRERRGKMECGQKAYPTGAAELDAKAWAARMHAHESAQTSSSSSRRWGRGSKTEPALPLRNVPHWPEPYLIEEQSGSEAEADGLFTTDARAYASEDYLHFNATYGPGGYTRWDLLQQHYPDIRFAESEEAIKADLLERIDVEELRCTSHDEGPAGRTRRSRSRGAGADEEYDDDDDDEAIELDDPVRKARARACFNELWELAIADLQRTGGVLRFPVTGFPAGKRRSSPTDLYADPYEAPLLLSLTSLRSAACSVRLAAISVIVDLLPWFALSTALIALVGYGQRRTKQGREEARIAGEVREEVIAALRERAATAAGAGVGAAALADPDAVADPLADLSMGAEESGQPYLPIAHLRDVLLPTAGADRAVRRRLSGAAAQGALSARDRLTPKRARKVWGIVRRQVGANSNVRTASREWKGETMPVWEWIGI